MPEPEFQPPTAPVPRVSPSFVERFKFWHLIAGLAFSALGGAVTFTWKVRAEIEGKASAEALAETRRTVAAHGERLGRVEESVRRFDGIDRRLDAIGARIDWFVETYYQRLPAHAKESVEPPPSKK